MEPGRMERLTQLGAAERVCVFPTELGWELEAG